MCQTPQLCRRRLLLRAQPGLPGVQVRRGEGARWEADRDEPAQVGH